MKKYWLIIIILLIIGAIIAGYFAYKKYNDKKLSANNSQPTVNNTLTAGNTSPSASVTKPEANTLVEPIADFKARIIKKPFGIYITPETSPVEPERFSGYHTGVDVEYQNIVDDVPVYAIGDGKVVLSQIISGYGGVFVTQVNINNGEHNVLYGHIRPTSLPPVDQTFKKGDQLGLLGTGYSSQTDGERRHLHFSVLSDTRNDVRGYVQTESALSGWIDPLSLYK